jgi:hypothetical protein
LLGPARRKTILLAVTVHCADFAPKTVNSDKRQGLPLAGMDD